MNLILQSLIAVCFLFDLSLARYLFSATNGAVGNLSYYCIASSDSGQRLAVGTLGGCLYTSSDYGSSWRCVNQAGTREWLQIASSGSGDRLAAIASNANGPLLSSDYGATWSTSVIYSRSQNENLYWYGIASSKAGDRLFVTMQLLNTNTNVRVNSIYLSTDYGISWDLCDVTLPSGVSNWSPGSIASDSAGKRIIAAAQYSFLYMSADSGRTWNVLSNSVPNCLPACRYFWASMAASNDGRVWAAAVNDGPLVISVDYGATWNSPSTNSNNSPGRRLWASVTSSADGRYLAAGGYGTNAWFSSDSGQTWTVPSSTFSAADLQVELVSSANGDRLAAATFPLGLYSTDNYGISWTASPPMTGVNQWRQVARASNTSFTIAASSTILYVSRSSSSPWLAVPGVPLGTGLNGVAISNDGLYSAAAGPDGFIYTSANFGASWVRQVQSSVGTTVFRWVSIASSTTGRIIAAIKQDDNIYLSYDFGVQWSIKDIVPTAYKSNNQWGGIACSSDGRYIFATSDSGIYVSTDTGNSWGNISSPEFFSYIACSGDGSILVACSTSAAFVSKDFGRTWTRNGISRERQYDFPSFTDVAASRNGDKLFVTLVYYVFDSSGTIISLSSQVYISEDFGNSWSLIYSEAISTTDLSDLTGRHFWNSLSSSADGLSLTLVPSVGYVTTAVYDGSDTDGSGSLSDGAIAGIAVGVTAAVSISAAVVYTSVFAKGSAALASSTAVSSSSVPLASNVAASSSVV